MNTSEQCGESEMLNYKGMHLERVSIETRQTSTHILEAIFETVNQPGPNSHVTLVVVTSIFANRRISCWIGNGCG